jgi:aflatoxin B1 aldehyde reductase
LIFEADEVQSSQVHFLHLHVFLFFLCLPVETSPSSQTYSAISSISMAPQTWAPTTKSKVNVVFGAMTIGNGAEQSRTTDINEAAAILDIFQSHGHNEIDTSRFYGGGSSEEYLGRLDYQKRGIIMDTKFYPTVGRAMDKDQWTHRPEHLRENLMRSLKALGAKKLDMWYLHGPDRTTPYEETMRGVNDLYKEGLFDRFAISNYMAWEVAQICEICDKHDWIKPCVYQGIYNAIHRSIEPELIPCLRHYDMGFYAYNPLGGGFFTGQFKKEGEVESGSRFDPNKWQGKMYRARYWNDSYFGALDIVRPVAEKHGLTLAETALRWMTHHSMLGREYPDAILIGASSTKHIEQNLKDLEKGPLPDDVLEALDQAWERVKPLCGKYWH